MESRELTAWRAIWNYFLEKNDKYRMELDKRESDRAGSWDLKFGARFRKRFESYKRRKMGNKGAKKIDIDKTYI